MRGRLRECIGQYSAYHVECLNHMMKDRVMQGRGRYVCEGVCSEGTEGLI